MDIEIIILSEINHTEKDKYHMISLIFEIKKKKKKTNEQNITIIKIQRLDWWLPDGKGVMG